jgi:hypothetical protein
MGACELNGCRWPSPLPVSPTSGRTQGAAIGARWRPPLFAETNLRTYGVLIGFLFESETMVASAPPDAVFFEPPYDVSRS